MDTAHSTYPKRLTNVDYILLSLLGRGGHGRRIDLIRDFERFRGYRLAPIYFARYKQQSPYYVFDSDRSTFKKTSSGYFRRGVQLDAKVAVWKLNGLGATRAHNLVRRILTPALADILG